MSKTIDYYNNNAEKFFTQYESVKTTVVHQNWIENLAQTRGVALDVGAGSGRDAMWLAKKGFDVFAVEPAEQLRALAQEKNNDPRITWLSDALPELKRIYKLNIRFDLILLSAVWMHVPESQRERAFRKIANLLKPGGHIVMSLRHGKNHGGRDMYPVNYSDVMCYAKVHALIETGHYEDNDKLSRQGINWETIILHLPDDGTGAFPLLRNIIVNDNKSSTYKVALLRVLLKIADGMPGVAIERDDESVMLPLGLVSLFWLRQYHRLLLGRVSFQQLNNSVAELGFVKKDGFKQLSSLSTYDLSISCQFNGASAVALGKTLGHVSSLIEKMPVRHLTYPGTETTIFSVEKKSIRNHPLDLTLSLGVLESYGCFVLPKSLWVAMSQYAVWIEPAIIHEWIGLMRRYKKNEKLNLSYGDYLQALDWLDAKRDTTKIRDAAADLQKRGKSIFCVWTGKKLKKEYEIDHCFPFSRWPNNDLWNLMPSSKKANSSKSDKLPTLERFEKSKNFIMDWWQSAYIDDSQKKVRFYQEAECGLPIIEANNNIEFIFSALEIQRTRLKQLQQLQDWGGIN
jgi:SAM-dependent methyltransferase